jgi:adenylate cyclase
MSLGNVLVEGFLSELPLRQRLATILVADVAGYSRLMGCDECGTVAALDSARAVFRQSVEAFEGRIVDMSGDSVLAVFDAATGAVKCALAVQHTLFESAQPLAEDCRMRFRIGIHLGDIMEKSDGTVYGDGVNIAARLESLAEPGGVAVSEAVLWAVRKRVEARFDDFGEHQVKNISEPVHAYRICEEATAAPADAAPAGRANAPTSPRSRCCRSTT